MPILIHQPYIAQSGEHLVHMTGAERLRQELGAGSSGTRQASRGTYAAITIRTEAIEANRGGTEADLARRSQLDAPPAHLARADWDTSLVDPHRDTVA
jgi:hypothetical protein